MPQCPIAGDATVGSLAACRFSSMYQIGNSLPLALTHFLDESNHVSVSLQISVNMNIVSTDEVHKSVSNLRRAQLLLRCPTRRGGSVLGGKLGEKRASAVFSHIVPKNGIFGLHFC